MLLFAFCKGINFLIIITPGLVVLLRVFNANKLKYTHTSSVWV